MATLTTNLSGEGISGTMKASVVATVKRSYRERGKTVYEVEPSEPALREIFGDVVKVPESSLRKFKS